MMSRLARRRPAFSFLAALVLMWVVSSVLPQRALAAGAGTNVTWAVSNNQAAAAGVNYSFSSRTSTGGIIKSVTITVSGTGLGGAAAIVLNYGVGAGTVAIAGQVITYTVTTAVSIPAGSPSFLQFSGLTNPAAGGYATAIVTRTAAAAIIDSGTTPIVTFAAGDTAKSITVEQSLTFALHTTRLTVAVDPLAPALVYRSHTSSITVLTNANSGYTLTVSANAASGGDRKHAGKGSAGSIVAQSTTATGPGANTIAITDRTAVDLVTAAPAGTFNYTLTANYN
jgi:hypothetical protein